MGIPKAYVPFTNLDASPSLLWFLFSFHQPSLYTEWVSAYSSLLSPHLGSAALSDLASRLCKSLAIVAISSLACSPSGVVAPRPLQPVKPSQALLSYLYPL